MIAAIGLGLSAVAFPLVANAAPTPVTEARAGTVGHVGRWFTDPQGRVLIFHGADTVSTSSDASGGAPLNPRDPPYMQRLGFNSSKIYVPWQSVEPQPGVYDDSFLNNLLVMQQTLWRSGIYSELDIEGGASWSNVNNGNFTVPGTGTTVTDPTGVLSGGAVPFTPASNQSEQNFWDNAPGPGGVGVQDRFDAMLTHFAAFFRYAPGIFGYGIINEPVPGNGDQPQSLLPTGDPHFDVDVLAPFYRKAFAAIRKADPTTLIHYEPDANFNLDYAPSFVPNLGDPNLVFDYHEYVDAAGSPFSGGPIGETRAQEAQQAADRNYAPAFNAERFFSVEGLDQLDQAMQGWNYFEWDPVGTPSENPLDQLDACPQQAPGGANGAQGGWAICFARPYPQAVAGTPTGWSFNEVSKSFTFSYDTRQPNGVLGKAPTEVFLPNLVYTNGYTLALQGAEVVGTSLGGQLLSIRANPGAASVSMTVTAK